MSEQIEKRSRRRGIFRIAVIGAGLIVAIAALFLYWNSRHLQQLANAYRTQAVVRGDIATAVSANGTLNPVVLVNVGTQVSGTVKALHVDFNDHVQAGQILLELDPALLKAQVGQSEAGAEAAKAAVALAIANEARARPMFEQHYITPEQYDQTVEALKAARAQLAQAHAQVAHDRTNLNYSVIRSPVSGVIVNRAIDVGQTVAANFQTPTLFQIARDLKKMQIDSSFAEADIGRIRPGLPVRFTVDAFPDQVFAAAVRQVRLNPTTVQNVVTYDVVVAVDNLDERLMPGMTAYVSVILDQRKDVLLVPNAALRFAPVPETQKMIGSPEKAGFGTVYVPGDKGPHAVRIETGLSDGRNVEVRGGDLKDGDRVIVGNADASSNGTPATAGMRIRAF